MSIHSVPADSSNLLLSEPPAADRHPAAMYLSTRTPGSRDRIRANLDAVAAVLTAGRGTSDTLAWHLLRHEHIAGIRAALAEQHPPAAANAMLAGLRGVLRQCLRIGLMSAGDYRRAHAAASANQGSRGGVRSVFDSVEDAPPTVERDGAVRTLLYGNGARQRGALTEVPGPQAPPPSAKGTAMSMEQLHLRRVHPRVAMAHALWEAGACLRSSAFCATLAMLRRALDLWSAEYRPRHGGPGAEGPGDLVGRLTRIAEENTLHHDTIRAIVDGLSHDAPGTDAPLVCRGGYVTGYDAYAVTRIKETYRNLHDLVVTLITTTMPDLPL